METTWITALGLLNIATVSGISHVTRGENLNSVKAKSFHISRETIGQFSGQFAETVSSRSFLQCTSYFLANSDYVGNLYDDEEKNCYLLNATSGVREKADDAGEVKVILYEPVVDVGPSFADCLAWYQNGSMADGIYFINPDSAGAFPVYCDMSYKGGGWTVFQRRVDDSVDFNRTWVDYVNGFGDLEGNLWMGLEKLHAMTRVETQLHVYLESFFSDRATIWYPDFSVGNASSGYRLSVGVQYEGSAGDSLTQHNGMKFSTYDNDQDIKPTTNCAALYGAGWWFGHTNDCYAANLNGKYLPEDHVFILQMSEGIVWSTFKGLQHSYKKVIMKLKRGN